MALLVLGMAGGFVLGQTWGFDLGFEGAVAGLFVVVVLKTLADLFGLRGE